MVKKNCCVFISGTGTNLKALIHSSRNYNFPINIKLVISNRRNSTGLMYAKKYSIPYTVLDTKNNLHEKRIFNEFKEKKIDLICLAGYMKILSKNFINNFNGNIINIHPSLLPKYKGTNTFKRIMKNQEKITGCTVHFVNDKLDSGKVILNKTFEINSKDNEISLKRKTQVCEYQAYSRAIVKLYMY